MKSWYVTSSKDGYSLHAVEYSVFRHAVESAHGWACWATRGWLGGHGLPEVFFKIPVGKRVWSDDEEDPYLENSVALKLCDAEQAVVQWAAKKEITRLRMPISDGVAEKLDPSLVKTMKEIYSED